ncbi:AUGMIN subunit 8 [Salvia miltiorrhiza]|uniref:AUGMIN subunit 8 n=1 Tax=Salvia miltiorrhiza TaxID=226208 RepID=UPI0025AD9B44|nr:AUGMIN subunit 8 [Salvia miltiorrhiza]XP_057767800.1 AUGMIN subunit 8 [Salvia miltiorrhiza]XP_057767801.1 AUGMIN subunit 8 [Salvia miltiorrhiza]XP_057767802.1 AUGMIN subunit 8 [Salvia miltiorrhiza]XP_057767803.1 AUGMIN subunit 8 [Salvia miltiorrhiza]
MDVCESERAVGKQSATVTLRPPLVSADNKNGAATRRCRTREVSSRYMSPTRSAATVPKRCPSPNAGRASMVSTVPLPKRAESAERRRPSTPSSPRRPSPSTPVQDTAAAILVTPRKASSNKSSPDSLWPSTMRSLNASFQSDVVGAPIGKKVSRTLSDRTLKPPSNVARKGESPTARKPTPEKKRSPLRGKNSADQLENSKPVDSLPPSLLDQHRWPSRASGRASSIPSRSGATEKVNQAPSLSHSRMATPSIRRLSLDGTSKPVRKSASDLLMPTSHVESEKQMFCGSAVHDGSQKLQRPSSSSSSERSSLMSAAARTQSLPIPRSRPSSPSVSRGVSPSRGRIVNPSSRGTSPARVRPSSPSRQPQDTSVLSFIADIRKGKKAANDIEDVHQLRLLYNRHLQWRYTNARTDAAMRSHKAKAEKMLYNIWRVIIDLSDSVRKRRSNLQQLRLKLKLYSVLVDQASCLDEWASIERDHTNSITWAIQDLQASTLRIPVTEGTRVDIRSVKGAMCSAVNVMKAMASSLRSSLQQVEGMNSLVSELADVAARERAVLNECESLFGSIAALQVEEDSLRTHLLQMKQSWRGDQLSLIGY